MVDRRQRSTGQQRRGGRWALGLLLVYLCLLPLAEGRAQDQEAPAAEGESGRGGVVINLPPEPQLAPATGIVVVDVQRVLEESVAVQAVQGQLTAARQAFQEEMRGREAALQDRDKELAAKRASMDEALFQEQRDLLAHDLAGLQEDIRVWFRAHDQAQNQALRQAQQVLLRIVGDLARQRGASVVIPKSSIVLVQPNLDITEAALQRLNAELPSLPAPVLPSQSEP